MASRDVNKQSFQTEAGGNISRDIQSTDWGRRGLHVGDWCLNADLYSCLPVKKFNSEGLMLGIKEDLARLQRAIITLFTKAAMASRLKATNEIQKRKDKGKGKSTANGEDNDETAVATTKPRKDKVLLISSRGVTQRMRHLLHDLEALLPHTKKGQSMPWAVQLLKDSQVLTLGHRLEARLQILSAPAERAVGSPLVLQHPVL